MVYKVRAPALPIQPSEYDHRQQDQFQNALRLYFNRLDDYLASLSNSGGGGGSQLYFPYIAASDTVDQLATASNTATPVEFNTLESGNGFTLNPPGTATAFVSGVYKITYSLQFVNTDNVIHNAYVWLKINNIDVPDSTTVFTLAARKSAGVYNYLSAYSEVTFTLNAGDELELYWAVDQAYSISPAADGIYMEHLPAQTVPYARPVTPSAIGSITFVSSL